MTDDRATDFSIRTTFFFSSSLVFCSQPSHANSPTRMPHGKAVSTQPALKRERRIPVLLGFPADIPSWPRFCLYLFFGVETMAEVIILRNWGPTLPAP